jgi:hypothetical protein
VHHQKGNINNSQIRQILIKFNKQNIKPSQITLLKYTHIQWSTGTLRTKCVPVSDTFLCQTPTLMIILNYINFKLWLYWIISISNYYRCGRVGEYVATCFLLHKYHKIEEKTIHSTNSNSLTKIRSHTSKSYIDHEINK